MEKGRGNHFRGKKLNEIELENEVYCSSESEDDEPIMKKVLDKVLSRKQTFTMEDEINNIPENINTIPLDINDVNNQEEIANDNGYNKNISENDPVLKKRKSKYTWPNKT